MHKVVTQLFEKNLLLRKLASSKVGVTAFFSVMLVSCVYKITQKQPEPEVSLGSVELAQLGEKPDFQSFADISAKKQAFFDYLRPGIEAENQRILKEREYLLGLQSAFDENRLSEGQLASTNELAERYKVPLPEGGVSQGWLDKMNLRVNVLPETLVLTQAANESAWGTSRFAREANNYFGQWCYQKGCGLVPLQRNDGASHEVAKFASAAESVHRYFMNVNRNKAYAQLRKIRSGLVLGGVNLMSTKAASELTNGLLKYSERGQDYVNDLQAMIRHNAQYWSQ